MHQGIGVVTVRAALAASGQPRLPISVAVGAGARADDVGCGVLPACPPGTRSACRTAGSTGALAAVASTAPQEKDCKQTRNGQKDVAHGVLLR